MKFLKSLNNRFLSLAGFSFLFAYLLSFLFEGQVLYGLLDYFSVTYSYYITAAIAAHFAGLFSGGLFIRNSYSARVAMLAGMGVCLIVTLPFFFAPSVLWVAGLIIGGFVSGCSVAAWGFFLKLYTPKNERIKSCADVLIFSNILMIAVDVTAVFWSPFAGLGVAVLCIPIGGLFIWLLPKNKDNMIAKSKEIRTNFSVNHPLWMLCLFVFVITIDSGLMYQVINPAFTHLSTLTSWYWAIPYIMALIILRNLPLKAKRSKVLYIGMGMIMAAFISFMLLDRKTADYFIVDTLMLGACGIFDLFWWSILGEMLDYTNNPVKVFGIGLSSNVLGVLCGGVLGMFITSASMPGAEVAVIALSVVCVTLVLLPPLNRQLVLLLKSHTYLTAYSGMSQTEQTAVVNQIKTLNPLTAREQEVLQLILTGKSNRIIGEALFISENTVKTHVKSIYSKYDVSGRAELISTLLKNQGAE